MALNKTLLAISAFWAKSALAPIRERSARTPTIPAGGAMGFTSSLQPLVQSRRLFSIYCEQVTIMAPSSRQPATRAATTSLLTHGKKPPRLIRRFRPAARRLCAGRYYTPASDVLLNVTASTLCRARCR